MNSPTEIACQNTRPPKDLLPFEKTDREIIVRKEGKTNPEFGCDPNKRKIEELIHYGIVNINKPSGPTSHQISDYVQRIFEINKAGHSGTLAVKK